MKRSRLLCLAPILALSLMIFGCGADSRSDKFCDDGVRNQDETDVDCGGSCVGCAAGQTCSAFSDCLSGNCDNGVCTAPVETCDDGIQNQDESAIDCGGTICAGCPIGSTCDTGTDCITGNCDNGFCADAPACADDGDCGVNASCIDVGGSMLCVCDAGYVGNGSTCVDVDECTDGLDDCDENATCTNTDGSFSCVCNAGYSGDGTTCTDVDECTDGNHNCDDNAACTNLSGSFSCACNAGYVGDGVVCVDVDECTDGLDNCDENATCTNTDGGFSCTCNAGYGGDGVTCTQLEACNDDGDCGTNASCVDVAGSLLCACDAGYQGDGMTCTDVDECADGTHNCDENATCTNSSGGFSCACNAGYVGDGLFCSDVDECTDGLDNCDENATCTNNGGGFSCACNAGYSGDGVTCTDVDECTDGTHNCDPNAICTNSGGGFSCACNAGYAGDGVTCADVDECTDGLDNCDENATCTNADGGFSCACNPGYGGDGVTCTPLGDCIDDGDCDANASCVDVAGSMVCQCDAGYQGDGMTCTDVDECTDGTHNCDENATCTNSDGSFSCTCNDGYTGDGVVCTGFEFEGREWITNGVLQIVQFQGQTALQLTRAFPTEEVLAYCPDDPPFESGVIEMDIASPHGPTINTYLGVVFRMQDMESYENLYFRPHLSGVPNAIQYEPVYSQAESDVWIRHRDPEFQQAAAIPANQWFHVRIVVTDLRMQVYIDGEAQPSMDRKPLLGINRAGYVGLKLFGGLDRTVLFANITITPDPVPSGTSWTQFQDGILPTGAYAGTSDTWIDADNPGTNYGADQMLLTDGQPDGSTLLKWDTSSIPAGTPVTGAWLVVDCANVTDTTFPVYALNRDWQAGGVTWNEFAAGSAWEVAGAQGASDRGSVELGRYINPVIAEDGTITTGTKTVELNADGIALVQGWIDDPATNFGVVIQDYDATPNGLGLSSSEAGSVWLRPKLIVEYSD